MSLGPSLYSVLDIRVTARRWNARVSWPHLGQDQAYALTFRLYTPILSSVIHVRQCASDR